MGDSFLRFQSGIEIDDYSLKIENLPQAPPKPGQPGFTNNVQGRMSKASQ